MKKWLSLPGDLFSKSLQWLIKLADKEKTLPWRWRIITWPLMLAANFSVLIGIFAAIVTGLWLALYSFLFLAQVVS